MTVRRFQGLVVLRCALAVSLMCLSQTANAQQYPSRAISILTAVAPGSPFDLLGRIFAERLRQKLGVPVVLENITGGQGLIATQRALNAKSDGYTLLLAGGGLATSPIVIKNAGYKTEDFVTVAPLGQVLTGPH